MLSAEMLREVLDYSPNTGAFVWKINRGGKALKGSKAGIVQHGKYLCIRVCGSTYMAHRLAWLYMHGKWPEHQIDHINGVKTDNRIENLRDVTQNVNMQNAVHPKRSSTTGYRGVFKVRSRYIAIIRKDGVKYPLGRFDTPAEASAAYLRAKAQLHGEAIGHVLASAAAGRTSSGLA